MKEHAGLVLFAKIYNLLLRKLIIYKANYKIEYFKKLFNIFLVGIL